MRVLRLRIWHLVFADCTRLRVELADQRAGVSRVPDVATLILGEAMRSGVSRLQRIFLELARLRIEPTQHIGHLAGVPESAVSRC